ncbi:MFS transporter [Lentibacillus sp.]|uniref:MFS transporter n=1 Tax=Lentibacillus sp. TaxID=1925746 RepID=UPI002B4B2BF5|nr:MFS transporter [Lentibacillus sp.]HLS09135.1 MFS transporter [Lentibacillus sp.]
MALHLIRQRNFLFIWIARQISALGDWILLIVLPLYIYNLTGSTIATGTMFITQMIPRLLFGSIAGSVVERLNKKWVLVFTDFMRGLILSCLFIFSTEQLWVFFVIVFAQSTIGTVFMPAHRALMVEIIERDHLVDANSITIVSDNIIRLAGPSLGGALLGIGGLHISIGVDILSYIVSGIFISLITVSSINHSKPQVKTSLMKKWLTFWSEWWGGIKIIRQNHLFLIIFWVLSITWLAQGMINVLFVPYVLDIMGQSSVEFGWIESAEGAGGLIGGYLLLKLNKKVKPFPLIMSSLLLTGFMFFLMFNLPYLLVVLVLNALLGIPNIMFSVRLETLLQEHTPDDYLGRVFGSYNTMVSLATLAGMAVASILNFAGTVLLLNLTAVLFIALGCVFYRPLRLELDKQVELG